MQDLLAIASLLLLRLALPALLIGLAVYFVLNRTKANLRTDLQGLPQGRSMTPTQWARAVTVPPVVPCWEKKHCDPASRAKCVAYTHAHVPCWLAFAVADGQTPTECRTCEMYAVPKREVPFLRVVGGASVASGAACRSAAGSPACDGTGPD